MTRIVHAGQTVGGGYAAIDISWEGALPEDGTVRWTMRIASGDGVDHLELVHERTGGEFVAQYVAEPATDKRQDVAENVDVGDGQITIRFPADVVGVAVDWPSWTAAISLDDDEVAQHVVPKAP